MQRFSRRRASAAWLVCLVLGVLGLIAWVGYTVLQGPRSVSSSGDAGEVLDASGSPNSGASDSVNPSRSGASGGSATDSQGRGVGSGAALELGAVEVGRSEAPLAAGSDGADTEQEVLHFRVIDAQTEEPVVGAQLRLFDQSKQRMGRSDSEGRLELLWPQSALGLGDGSDEGKGDSQANLIEQQIECSHERYLSMHSVLSALPGAEELDPPSEPQFVLALDRAASIRVRLKGAAKHPAQGRVAVWREDRSPEREVEMWQTDDLQDPSDLLASNSDEFLEINGLPKGLYHLAALAEGTGIGLKPGLQLQMGEALVVELDLPRAAQVHGRVTQREDSSSVEGAEINLRWRGPGVPRELCEAWSQQATTDPTGNYVCEGVSAGLQSLFLSDPAGVELYHTVAVSSQGERVEHNIRLGDLASLEGVVQDASKQGISGASVWLFDRDSVGELSLMLNGSMPTPFASTVCDGAGRYLLEGLPTAQRFVAVGLPAGFSEGDFASWAQASVDSAANGSSTPSVQKTPSERMWLPSRPRELHLRPGEDKQNFQLQLEEGSRLIGSVVDVNGQPIQGAELSLAQSTRLGDLSILPFYSDEAGLFERSGLPRGAQTLEVRFEGFAVGTRKVNLPASGELEVDFVLQPAKTISVQVVDTRGRGIAHAKVRLRRQIDPNQVAEGKQPKAAKNKKNSKVAKANGKPRYEHLVERTGAHGGVLFEHLPEGLWEATVEATGWELEDCSLGIPTVGRPELLVPDEEFVEFVLAPQLEARAGVHGTAMTNRGDGIPLRLSVQGLSRGLVQVDGGRFEVGGILPGRAKLRLGADHCLTREMPLDLIAGADLDLGWIELASICELKIELRDKNGKPVNKAQLILDPKLPKGETAKKRKRKKQAPAYGELRRVKLKQSKPANKGVYSAKQILPGSYTLSVRVGKQKPQLRTFKVKERNRQTSKVKLK